MGWIAISRHTGERETYQHDGPFIDFLLANFPDGFGGMAVRVELNGRVLETADYDALILDEDRVVIRLAPAGIALLVTSIIGAVAAVGSLVFSLIALSRLSQGGSQGSSISTVDARANRVNLGGTVPVKYGRTYDTPDFAAQSYRFFENHQERRVYLLSLGAGSYDLEDIVIGETPLGSFPPGTARFEVYTPDEHGNLAGFIGESFGIDENVVTSGAVDNQELRDRERLEDDTRRADIVNNNTILFRRSTDFASAGINSGDDLIITTPARLAGTYTIASNTETTLTIDGVFPGANGPISDRLRYRIEAANAGQVGPFPANPPGTRINRIEFDIEMPSGQLISDGEEELTLVLDFTIQAIDDDGQTTGAPIFRTATRTDASVNGRGYSISFPLPEARYQASARASFTEEITANDRALVNWTGLKGFIVQSEGKPSFTNQTILAMVLNGTDEISQNSQSRIFTRQISILKNIETGEFEPSNNPADIAADIWTNSNYGAGQSEADLDMPSLLSLRARAKNTPGWNGIFTERISAQDALNSVMQVFQARPYRRRRSLGVVFDDVKPLRRALVLPETRLRDSLTVTTRWVGEGDNDGVEVRYRRAEDFEEASVFWPPEESDPRRLIANDLPPSPINPRGSEVRGITNEAQANIHAQYLYNASIARNMTVSFTVELEAMVWQPFDRVGVIIPAFGLGDSREIFAIAGRSLTVDRAVEAGAYVTAFVLADGTVMDGISAVADGSDTILLSADVPVDIPPFDGQFPPVLAIMPRADAILDCIITEIQPSRDRVQVSCVNYDPDAPTLEALQNA